MGRQTPETSAAPEHEYRVGKYLYIVTPVYKESGKTIHELMFNLMKKDTEKHEKS